MRHDNVLRAIDNLQKSLLNFEEPSKMFVVSKRKADDGQYHKMYLMNRDGFSLLVMGFTGKNALEWKLQYIRAFKQMENFIREKPMLFRSLYPMHKSRGAIMRKCFMRLIPDLQIKWLELVKEMKLR